MHKAVERGHLGVFNILAAYGYDPNDTAENGRRLLHFAAAVPGYSGLAMTEHLLRAGAELDTQDVEGATPLYVASRCGNEPVVRMLLEAGAKLALGPG